MKQVSDESDDNTICSVFSELKSLGVKVPKIKKFKSGIPKQAKEISSITGKIFGVYLSEQEKISVSDYVLPKFIFTCTSYLKKYIKIEIGLFRKAGSVTRQRDLRAKLERGESIEECEPNDVASLLKKWLRELPEPLIPVYLQDLFIRCQNLQIEENRIAAILLCCHLLPVEHLHTLKHLLEFLSDIATNSDKNKMGARNLALIMAPNIFVMGSESVDKSSSNLVQLHTSIVELLINNVQRIVTSQCTSLHSVESHTLKYSTDLDLSTEVLDYSPSKSKKKRRSGPVQDLLTGFRKLVGQNSTPPNSSKWWNQDDDKLAPSTSRSASKRKAGPEQLSLSPLKKQATAANVFQSRGLNFTPNSKCSQNDVGNVKEKTGNAHSRRKSFGLLRKKDKKSRQKSSKPNALMINKVEPTVSTSTPSPFEEKLVSLQEPEESKDTYPSSSSPLLSTSDIDRILSKSTFTKKSISDCYLTVHEDGYQKRPVFSTSSSEGCLYGKGSKNSPYNLRSGGLNKRFLKRKSEVLNGVCVADQENVRQSSSPKLFKEISPLTKHASPKQETLKSSNIIITSVPKSSSRQKDNSLIRSCDQTDSLNTSQAFNRRGSSRRQKKNNLRDSSVSSVSKSENLVANNCQDNNIIVVKVDAPNCTSTEVSFNSSNKLFVENEDKIKRQCSLKRQEAFVVRSKSVKKMNSSQIRRADSIKIANSKSKNQICLQRENLNSSDINPAEKKNLNVGSTNTPEKRRIKRTVRNGSIVRGRPNTVKTGLPSDLCIRYNSESVSTNASRNVLTSTSSDDKDLFANIVNEFEKKDDDCITLKIQNITLSTPRKEISSIKVNANGGNQNSSFQTTVSFDVKETKKRNRERICSNSDSKIHKMKTRSSKIARINSFPEHALSRPKIKDLKPVDSSSPMKSEVKESKIVPNEVEKENAFVLESPLSTSNDNVFKTPSVNFQTPETWFSGREYLENEKPREDDDSTHKRESIAMILKNKSGHVQQKVHMYDHRSRSSSTCTPSGIRSATRGGSLKDSRYSNMQNGLSQKKSTSVRSNRSVKNRYSPLPPPPKFVIPDSPLKPSYPLKELTNISNAGDTTFSPSPAKTTLSTPNNKVNSTEKINRKCTLKPKRNSYSGHTPYKLPKDMKRVLRSESSPLLQKAVNKSQKLIEYTELSPVLQISDQNSSLSSTKSDFNTAVFKTRSSLSIDKLRSDQLTDEWLCEM